MAKYIDDSTLWSVSSTSENSQLQQSAQEADMCADDSLMSLNYDKTIKTWLWTSHGNVPSVPATKLGGSQVEHVSQEKLLGVILSNDLKWQGHIDYVCGKASSRLYFLRMPR